MSRRTLWALLCDVAAHIQPQSSTISTNYNGPTLATATPSAARDAAFPPPERDPPPPSSPPMYSLSGGAGGATEGSVGSTARTRRIVTGLLLCFG
jgi:hypothetical protein